MLQAAHNTLVRSSDVPPDMMTRSHMESLRNRDIITIKQLGVKYILVHLSQSPFISPVFFINVYILGSHDGKQEKEVRVVLLLSILFIFRRCSHESRFGFTVCSSEKVDMHERYATFTIASIPYPGTTLN